MKESEARNFLNQFMIGVQRVRSIEKETFGDISQEVMEFFHPYTWGKKCPLNGLQKILDMKEIKPMDFYNMMALATMMPSELSIVLWAENQTELPLPDVSWLKNGWEKE